MGERCVFLHEWYVWLYETHIYQIEVSLSFFKRSSSFLNELIPFGQLSDRKNHTFPFKDHLIQLFSGITVIEVVLMINDKRYPKN